MQYCSKVEANFLLSAESLEGIKKIRADLMLSFFMLIDFFSVLVEFSMNNVLTMVEDDIKRIGTLDLVSEDFFVSKVLEIVHLKINLSGIINLRDIK
jgi:hypothetical protein